MSLHFPPQPTAALARVAMRANAARMDLDTLLDRLAAWQDVHARARRLSAEWQEAGRRISVYRAIVALRS